MGWLAMRLMSQGNPPSIILGIQRLNLVATDVFVELGAGHGVGLKSLGLKEEIPKRIVAVEISPNFRALVEKVKEEVPYGDRVEIYGDDCKQMPFLEDNSVDKMFAMNVVYFLNPLDEYLPEIHRVLKPDGIVVFGCKFDLIPQDSDVFVNVKEELVVEKMEAAGLEVTSTCVDESGARHTELLGRKKAN